MASTALGDEPQKKTEGDEKTALALSPAPSGSASQSTQTPLEGEQSILTTPIGSVLKLDKFQHNLALYNQCLGIAVFLDPFKVNEITRTSPYTISVALLIAEYAALAFDEPDAKIVASPQITKDTPGSVIKVDQKVISEDDALYLVHTGNNPALQQESQSFDHFEGMDDHQEPADLRDYEKLIPDNIQALKKVHPFGGNWLIMYKTPKGKLITVGYYMIPPFLDKDGRSHPAIYFARHWRGHGFGPRVNTAVNGFIIGTWKGSPYPFLETTAANAVMDTITSRNELDGYRAFKDVPIVNARFTGLKGDIHSTNWASIIAAQRAGSLFSGIKTYLYPSFFYQWTKEPSSSEIALFEETTRLLYDPATKQRGLEELAKMGVEVTPTSMGGMSYEVCYPPVPAAKDYATQQAKMAFTMLLNKNTRPQGIALLTSLRESVDVAGSVLGNILETVTKVKVASSTATAAAK